MSGGAEAWVLTAGELWPGAEVTRTRGGTPPRRELVFLPDAESPRLLLPAGLPGAAAAAMRRYSHDLTVRQRVSRGMAATALRTGLPGRALRDRLYVTGGGASIEDRLAELLGREVVVTVGLGTARANRKPILHVLTPRGRPVAFVKVGDNDVVRSLIADEAAALTLLAGHSPRSFTVPEVLFHGEWSGLSLLVLSPLPTRALSLRPRGGPPLAAMRELAGLTGRAVRRVGDTAFWRDLAAAPGDLDDPDRAARLASAVDRLGAAHGDRDLEFGAWHGDWTPWNMAWYRGVVQLWDWERFAPEVPWGFDLTHYRLQEATRLPGPSPYERRPARAAELLEPAGLTGPAARAVLDLYYLALCCRYQRAAQGPRGTAVRAQADRLLDLLEKPDQGES